MTVGRTCTARSGVAYEVRPATPGDGADLVGIIRRVADEGAYTLTESDEVNSDAAAMGARVAEAWRVGGLWLVATIDGRIVGELSGRPGSRRRIAHRLRFGLSVESAWRGQGIGRALIEVMLEWARANERIEKVVLGVFADNTRAISLYRSMGFEEEGRRRGEFKVGPGRYSDDLIMARWVKGGPHTSSRL